MARKAAHVGSQVVLQCSPAPGASRLHGRRQRLCALLLHHRLQERRADSALRGAPVARPARAARPPHERVLAAVSMPQRGYPCSDASLRVSCTYAAGSGQRGPATFPARLTGRWRRRPVTRGRNASGGAFGCARVPGARGSAWHACGVASCPPVFPRLLRLPLAWKATAPVCATPSPPFAGATGRPRSGGRLLLVQLGRRARLTNASLLLYRCRSAAIHVRTHRCGCHARTQRARGSAVPRRSRRG